MALSQPDIIKPVIYQILPRLAGNLNTANIPFGSIEENGCGKFNDLSDRFLEEIKKTGATHIWLTGTLEHASCTDYSQYGIPKGNPLVIKGIAGSPYAIRDYYDVCPDLAVNVENRMQEFEALIKRCHDKGLGPIIDFVPNHVARQYHSDKKPSRVEDFGVKDKKELNFSPANNFYYLPRQMLKLPQEAHQLPYTLNSSPYEENPARASGNDLFNNSPGFFDWYDSVKLNYGVDFQNNLQKHFEPIPDTWQKMLEILFYWAEKKVAGFRCDMAEMIPVEFWKWAIGKVREKHPEILFIAEIYKPGAYFDFRDKAGFNYLYDKEGMYNCLRSVLKGEKPAACITEVWQELGYLNDHMLRFIENHDEQRIASRQFAGNPRAGIPAMGVCALMHRGPVMLYFGQEFGEPAEGTAGYSGDDGRTTIFDYFSVPAFQRWFNNGQCNQEKLSKEEKELYTFYRILFDLCQDPVISRGHFYDLMWYNRRSKYFDESYLYCFCRWDNNKNWLIVVNFHSEKSFHSNIRIPAHYWETTGKPHDCQIRLERIMGEKQETLLVHKKQCINEGIKLSLSPYSVLIINLKESLKT